MRAIRRFPPFLVAAALVAAAGCEGPRGRAGDDGDPGPTGVPGPTPYIEPEDTFILTLTSAEVSATSRTLFVHFTLTDDEGVPRPPAGISMNWTAAVLRDDPETGFPAWTSYFTRHVIGAFGETDQPTSDAAGTYVDFGGGHHRYQFSVALPEGYEVSKTHRIGVYARRADESQPDGYEIENDWLDFVPDGSDVTETREVVMTENCNTCHDPLKAHGEFRREVELCVTCHNPDLYDPDSEDTYDPGSGAMNPLDLKVLTHRIHQGIELPSVVKARARGELGFAYDVIGYGGTPHVYAEVIPDNPDADTALEIEGITFPRDQQNCTTCHTGGADSARHRTTVTREACGSCHDSTYFEAMPPFVPVTMDSHAGGAFTTDVACASCHVPDQTTEFDLSVQGAHTIPTRSAQLAGFQYQILSAALVGTQLTVVFTVENGDGSPVTNINLSAYSANMLVNGPTGDYRLDNYYRANVRAISVYDSGTETWSVTLPNRTATDPYFPNGPVIPAAAEGTFAVGLEMRRTVAVPGFGNVTEGAPNPVYYISVDGSDVMPRRTVVETETCNTCHDRLTLHGGQRREVEYCVMCHNPQNTDWSQRPKTGGNVNLAATGDGLEERSIDFRTMIHKIHTGEELDATDPYLIYGFGNSLHFYESVRFPGDMRRCTTCHEEDTWLIESVPDEALGVVANETGAVLHSQSIKHAAGEKTIPPVTSACIACHDTDGARVHSELNTNASGEESCVVCHGENREFSVRKVHGAEDWSE